MRWRDWARYGAPGVMLGLAVSWSAGVRAPSARAQGPVSGAVPGRPAFDRPRPTAPGPAGEASGTIALTTPLAAGGQMLLLVDTHARAFAVYRVDPGNPKGTVKLEAARQYQCDLKLDEYNNQEPGVAAIESTVKSMGTRAGR
jgi:hypothetical protein